MTRNTQNTTPSHIKTRLKLYIKGGYTTFWIWWHRALEKNVGTSNTWKTLEEEREARRINMGFYEEWLRT